MKKTPDIHETMKRIENGSIDNIGNPEDLREIKKQLDMYDPRDADSRSIIQQELFQESTDLFCEQIDLCRRKIEERLGDIEVGSRHGRIRY